MRLGMSEAFLPERMADFTPAVARRVRELGYSGVFARFTQEDPHEISSVRCRRVRAVSEAEGVRLFQATGYRPPLIHPDESERRSAVRTLCAALRVARDLGARAVATGPGSMSPRGPWFPHPYNYTPRARRQLVKSLREAAGAAEEYGVLLSVEGHQLVTLSSVRITRDVVDEVGSAWVKVEFDPVNWIALDTVYETGVAIAEMFATLGTRIASSHVKDVVVEDRLVVHLEPCTIGAGVVDLRAQLRGMEQVDSEAPVITELAATAELAEVNALLVRTADELGIPILD